MSARSTPPHKFTQLDRRILGFVAENPGCLRTEASKMGDRLTQLSEWEHRHRRLNALIERGLVRDKGRPHHLRLYLTDAGRAVLAEDDS